MAHSRRARRVVGGIVVQGGSLVGAHEGKSVGGGCAERKEGVVAFIPTTAPPINVVFFSFASHFSNSHYHKHKHARPTRIPAARATPLGYFARTCSAPTKGVTFSHAGDSRSVSLFVLCPCTVF
jgi:hypothetical protein